MRASFCIFVMLLAGALAAQQPQSIPNGPLTFGAFSGQFRADGTFSIAGQGWPTMIGTWKTAGSSLELVLTKAPNPACADPGKYTFTTDGVHLTLQLVSDTCQNRRMILDRSAWRPVGEAESVPERRIVRTAAASFGASAGGHQRARQLAVVPRPRRRRRQRWPATAGHLGRQDRGERAVEDGDPRPLALEPDRVGRACVSGVGGQSGSEGHVQARPLWRRRRV